MHTCETVSRNLGHVRQDDDIMQLQSPGDVDLRQQASFLIPWFTF